MIRPPGFRGVAFTTIGEGDLRGDLDARRATGDRLGIPGEWATVVQVHGSTVRRAERPGSVGEGDALFTKATGLPLAVFTADCLAVALEADSGIGIAHAGWRGVATGVIGRLREAMEAAGLRVRRAAIGPGIGPCCFEVGDAVGGRFPDRGALTRWGSPSVDLWAAAEDQLQGLEVWNALRCTRDDPDFFSYRRDGTSLRAAGIVWMS